MHMLNNLFAFIRLAERQAMLKSNMDANAGGKIKVGKVITVTFLKVYMTKKKLANNRVI